MSKREHPSERDDDGDDRGKRVRGDDHHDGHHRSTRTAAERVDASHRGHDADEHDVGANGGARSSIASPSSASGHAPSSYAYPLPPPPPAAASLSSPAAVEEEVRLLIDNAQVGGLIGRAGANVSAIREQSGAHVSILKLDPRVQDGGATQTERIATVKGPDDAVVKAIKLIADILVSSSSSSRREGAEGQSHETSLRYLVHQSRLAAIVGKSGDLVRQTQAQTGARVSVTAEVLGQSTEKAVLIGGTPMVIQAAFARILEQLKHSPLKEGVTSVLYTPTITAAAGAGALPPYPPPPPPPGAAAHYPPPQYPPLPPGYPPYPPQPGYPLPPPPGGAPYPPPPGAGPPGYPYPPYYPPPPGYGRPPPPGYPPYMAAPPPREAPVSQKIAIPTVCSGCVLGKGGSIIKELRAQSGTNISLADPEPSTPNERVVTITGTPSAIQHAIYLIREAVEKYTPPSGGYGR